MRKNSAILFCLLILLIYTFLEYLLSTSIFSISYLHKSLFVAAISTLLFSIQNETNVTLHKQYIRGSYLFLVGFCLVHFQIYLDYVLGNIDSLNLGYSLNYSIINKASLTSTIALVSFYIGYAYKTINPGAIRQAKSPRIYQTQFLYYLCYVFFALFIITVNPDYIRGKSYGAIKDAYQAIGGIIPMYSQSYFLYCVYGIILVTTYNLWQNKIKLNMPKYIASFKKPYLVAILLFTVLVMLSGDRGPIIRIAIALFAGYILQSRKKINIIILLTALLIASTFVSVLGYFRATDTSLGVSARYSNALTNSELSQQQNSIFPAGMELAKVVRSYHGVYSSVEQNGIRGGEGMLLQTLGIVPGLGLIYITLTGRDGSDIGTASIVTRELGADHGMGTTTVADVYFDFGIVGVLVGFFLLGTLLRYLDHRLYNHTIPSLWIYTLGFSYIVSSVYIGRSSALLPLRDASLTYLFIYITNKLNKYK